MSIAPPTPGEEPRRPAASVEPQRAAIDERTEHTLGRVLQVGVLLAGAIVVGSGIAYLVAHAGDPASFRVFKAAPSGLRSPAAILGGLAQPGASGFIQLGILVLIATPILRVVMSVYSFARLRDVLYVVLTLVVLGVLAFGLLSGR